MGLKQTNAFRAHAVQIAVTAGLTRKAVAFDLGVGLCDAGQPGYRS